MAVRASHCRKQVELTENGTDSALHADEVVDAWGAKQQRHITFGIGNCSGPVAALRLLHSLHWAGSQRVQRCTQPGMLAKGHLRHPHQLAHPDFGCLLLLLTTLIVL